MVFDSNKSHGASSSKTTKSKEKQPAAENIQQAMSALQITSEVDISDWLPDSGASSHVTGYKFLLSDLKIYTGRDTVMIGNEKYLTITHIGNAYVATKTGFYA